MNTKNKIQLIGIVNHPSVARLDSDILKATFKIETQSNFTNKLGMKMKGVFNHNCEAFGKLAEVINRYVTNGTEIAIEGILVEDESTGNTYVQVNDLLLLSKKTN